jgi:DNA-binding PadR family transcriptional regulator
MSPHARLFGHGDLRLYLLRALEESPRHGYELIRLLEDRFLGLYTPSAGTIYPRLAAMEEDGLIEADEAGGRKVYRLTDAGRAELDDRRDEVDELETRVARSARDISREIRDDVRESVRDLRREIRDAARDVKREERRMAHEARHVAREARRVGEDARRTARSLQHDLESFVSDVSAAARRHRLDVDRIGDLREALFDARTIILEALEGRRRNEPPGPPEPPEPPRPPDPPRVPDPPYDRGDAPPHC